MILFAGRDVLCFHTVALSASYVTKYSKWQCNNGNNAHYLNDTRQKILSFSQEIFQFWDRVNNNLHLL